MKRFSVLPTSSCIYCLWREIQKCLSFKLWVWSSKYIFIIEKLKQVLFTITLGQFATQNGTFIFILLIIDSGILQMIRPYISLVKKKKYLHKLFWFFHAMIPWNVLISRYVNAAENNFLHIFLLELFILKLFLSANTKIAFELGTYFYEIMHNINM